MMVASNVTIQNSHAMLKISPEMHAVLRKRLPDMPPTVLDVRLGEFLKFIELAAKSDARQLPIAAEIDDIWHIFLLETREYAALCEQAGGFVHHTAKTTLPDNDFQSGLDDDLAFVVAYIESFGCFSESAMELWPALARLSAHLHLSTEVLLCFAQDLAAARRRRPVI